MPALASVVSDYIDTVQSALEGTGSGYLAAQDLASILELLQDAMASGELTATGGSTTTAVVTSIPSGVYVGATVTFEDDTTTVALQGVTTTVASHDGTTFTFDDTLAASVAAGDTFQVTVTAADDLISQIRDDQTDYPRGNVYPNWRTAVEGLNIVARTASGGTDLADVTVSRAGLETAAGSTDSAVVSVDTMRIDEFKNLELTISGETRKITGNTETEIRVEPALSSAPAAGTSFSIARPTLTSEVSRFNLVHPGGSSDQLFVSYLLGEAEAAVVALTLPT